MRNLTYVKHFSMMLVFLLSIALTFTSCTKDVMEEFLDQDNNTEVTEPSDPDDGDEDPGTTDPDPEDNTMGDINTTPCDYDLSALTANETLSIDCTIDLNGSTVDLPSNVTLEFNGGQVINGTLNFSGGKIAANLLNHQLNITGEADLTSDNFEFYPERWAITEGKTDDETALINKENILKAINQVHDLKGTNFSIGKMNAYFKVHVFWTNPDLLSEASILLPSNFNLIMAEDTYLRVQPNGSPGYNLISVYEGSNVTITGGNLIGDRWDHDYSPVNDLAGRARNSHEWGHVLKINGGKNILIENVNLSDSAGDLFGVHGSSLRNPDGTPGNSFISENVTMRNCVLDAARRNGMSILDGDGVLIENCEILNTAHGASASDGSFSSAGTWPKYGISFEAWRQRTDAGELLEYNKIENVTLRGNTFKGNIAGDVVLFTCSNIILENNFFDSRIGNVASHDIIFRNNTMEARIEEDGTPFNYAINFDSNIIEGEEMNYNYQIYGNTIKGYGNAMILGGQNFDVKNNTLINNKNSIGLGSLNEANFNGNIINSDIEYSVGYFTRGIEPKKVSVSNETIKVAYRPINLRNVTSQVGDPLIFSNSEFISTTNKDNFIQNSTHIIIEKNIINTDFILDNSNNIIIRENSN